MPAHSTVPHRPGALASLRAQRGSMLAALEQLTSLESPTPDVAAVRRCAVELLRLGEGILGAKGELLEVDGYPHLRWRFGTPRVLVIGHFDTVWPLGTLARWPFSVAGDIATGPGVYDMKAGVVQALYAIAVLPQRDGVELLVTGDEEVGSPTSRRLIEESAAGPTAALICEPAAQGRLKTGRKGCSFYRLVIDGVAAHGSQPERGVNALHELAEQVRVLDALANPELGTTVTVTTASAGSAQNTVPAHASMTVDVRSTTAAELERVDASLRALSPRARGASLHLQGDINRPPMEESAGRNLGERALALAAALGIDVPGTTQVPGGSDGNFTAGVGVPTLDGLGAVGDHAHAEGEYVNVAAMPERAALLAALISDILQRAA